MLLGGSALMVAAAGVMPFFDTLNGLQRWLVALMISVTMAARSPSSAMAVIAELGARGPFTQTALAVTMFGDVIVIVLFAITEEVAAVAVLADAVRARRRGCCSLRDCRG